MAIPVFNTFNESMKINQKTMNTVSANHIGQRVLEILKADGVIDGFDPHDSKTNTFVGSIDEFDIEYTLTDTLSTVDEINKDKVYAPSSSQNVDYGTIASLDDANIKIKYLKKEDGVSYFSYKGDFDTNWSKLLVEDSIENDSSSPFRVKFYEKNADGSETLINTTNVTADQLKVTVTVEGEPEKGRFDIENKSKKDVYLYEVDDQLALLRTVTKILANAGALEIHRNARSESADADNNRKVYTVEVKISKNSEVLEAFVGTIVK